MKVRIKRVYEAPHKLDGERILVDRLWPRGLSKEKANLDDWMRDIAPSDELRQWFGHRSERWEEFRKAYLDELETHRDELATIMDLAERGTITLLFAAKNQQQNNAAVIREWLSRNG
jgi:uncharacterized protein YeaO (DUF488 family)